MFNQYFKYTDGRFNPGDWIKIKDDTDMIFANISRDKSYRVVSTSRAGEMVHFELDGGPFLMGNYTSSYFELDKQHYRNIKLESIGI